MVLAFTRMTAIYSASEISYSGSGLHVTVNVVLPTDCKNVGGVGGQTMTIGGQSLEIFTHTASRIGHISSRCQDDRPRLHPAVDCNQASGGFQRNHFHLRRILDDVDRSAMIRAMIVMGVLALMVLGTAQASEADDLLNRLGELPGINVIQVNETTYLFVLQPTGSLDSASCGSTFTGDCSRCSGNTCCLTGCNHCGYISRIDTSICCREKGCTKGDALWCVGAGQPCF